ncbi:MAG: polysaccharide deacetylase family protein [Clostridiales bacterium]|jgi:peptidoglycan/xylan/chitin deacetylase (PgdA/CDA1 family)|nr:polysaccharide deacetylase family protein [Eubacteriales bacterium]MDH7566589.1 polysaccharide deacetylase family protein [Clostridiales bacterium]
MRIFAFNVKRSYKFFFALLLVIVSVILAAFFLPVEDAISVFSTERDLPIYCVDRSDKKVAITFDCAWGAEDIPHILDVLKRENVKATFFIVGQWAEKNPDAVKSIAGQGHDIGNHSYSHLRMGALDSKKIIQEISLSGKKLSEISGKNIELFRAPYGDYNNNVVGLARNLGYFTIQWDVDSL